MSKLFLVQGMSGKYGIDDFWTVAAFASKQKAEEWKERCEYYSAWVEKMSRESRNEEEEKKIGSEVLDVDSPEARVLTQWEWAVAGTETDQLRRASKEFGQSFSKWDDFGDFWEKLPREKQDEHNKKERLELGWMLSPYDPPQMIQGWEYSEAVRYVVTEVEQDPPLPQDGVERDASVLTMQALHDPQPGDRFTEMYSYWAYVVYRKGDEVWYSDANPPCSFPEDARLVKTTIPKMLKHFTNGRPKSWLRLSERGNDVTGWNDDSKYNKVEDER